MRGTLTTDKFLIDIPGIIPAYAGNTALAIASRTTRGDHPRVCGEHVFGLVPDRHTTGSSPRMRGTLTGAHISPCPKGIIPAYAGNTNPVHPDAAEAWDHPRVCGEHVTIPEDALLTAGSSPRMRGTRERIQARAGMEGIIPAYAGNTRLARWPVQAAWDHPRVCGEHTKRLA